MRPLLLLYTILFVTATLANSVPDDKPGKDIFGIPPTALDPTEKDPSWIDPDNLDLYDHYPYDYFCGIFKRALCCDGEFQWGGFRVLGCINCTLEIL